MSEPPASLYRCPRLASRADSRPGACAAPPQAARRRSPPARSLLIAIGADATALAEVLALVMAALVLDARRWVRLAARSRVGAQSEAQVRRALERAGGGGVAGASLAPLGWARGYRQRRDRPDRGRVHDRDQVRARSTNATWPAPARRPRGFIGIGGAGAVEERSRCCAWCAPAGSSTSRTRFSWCRLDRLAPALRAGAGTSPRPRFLAP